MKSSTSAPSDDPPSSTDGCLVLLNVPLATTEWDLRQMIEHVGVHSPITVRFEPGALPEINKVTLHFKNQIDLEIADVTLRETSWNTEDGGARIQIYRSEQGDGGSMWPGYPADKMKESQEAHAESASISQWMDHIAKTKFPDMCKSEFPKKRKIGEVLTKPDDDDDDEDSRAGDWSSPDKAAGPDTPSDREDSDTGGITCNQCISLGRCCHCGQPFDG